MERAQAEALKAIWCAYLDELKAAADELFRHTTPDDPLTAAEGLRHLTRVVRMGLESNVEFSDPDFPVLAQFVDETKKFGCDNPDTIYMRAMLNGRHSYRIVGNRGTVDYISFITSRAGQDGRAEAVAEIDSKSLAVADDGSFEIHLTPEPVSGNWLKLDEHTRAVGVRQTFLDRRRETPAELRIMRAGQAATPAPLTVDEMKSRLAGASGFALYCTKTFTDWTESYLAHPNQLPPADQEKCLKAGGDPNIYFYRSFWSLDPDEALIVHIPRIPACDTWNLQVDNFWQESMDYRYYRSSTNKHTTAYNGDGSATIVIAHEDPDHPNWLSTAGHRLGHFAMRWIRAAEHVDPVTRVCRFQDIGRTIREMEAP